MLQCFSVASFTIRAGAWLASSRIWTVRKCWSNRSLNSRSCSEGLPNLPSVLNLVCGQEEHVPTTGFLPCHLIITRLGFFLTIVVCFSLGHSCSRNLYSK